MSKNYIIYLCIIGGLLLSANAFGQKKSDPIRPNPVEPRLLISEGITTEVNNKTVTSYFNFSFGVVTIQIKNMAEQPIYSAKVDTNTTIALVISNAPLTTGAYTIIYTDSKGTIIAKFTFNIG